MARQLQRYSVLHNHNSVTMVWATSPTDAKREARGCNDYPIRIHSVDLSEPWEGTFTANPERDPGLMQALAKALVPHVKERLSNW